MDETVPTAARLLVIDDDPAVQRSIRRQLKSAASLSVVFESDPVAGLSRIDRERYDLVMCDIKMTPIGGLEVLARIKEAHPTLPVIILTGFVDDQIIERAQALGCADFLIKPVRKGQLVEAITKVLEGSA
jgi:two-component system, chemotaxis family, chemotaxis protein CheY